MIEVGLYAPKTHDTQGPHEQDERRAFAAQDVIFVEAGTPHRLEAFSEDFATWVIFWGPPGGEA